MGNNFSFTTLRFLSVIISIKSLPSFETVWSSWQLRNFVFTFWFHLLCRPLNNWYILLIETPLFLLSKMILFHQSRKILNYNQSKRYPLTTVYYFNFGAMNSSIPIFPHFVWLTMKLMMTRSAPRTNSTQACIIYCLESSLFLLDGCVIITFKNFLFIQQIGDSPPGGRQQSALMFMFM